MAGGDVAGADTKAEERAGGVSKRMASVFDSADLARSGDDAEGEEAAVLSVFEGAVEMVLNGRPVLWMNDVEEQGGIFFEFLG